MGSAIPDEQRAIAIAAYQSGDNLKEAGDKIGVSTTAVYKWLVAAGIPRRPQGRAHGSKFVNGARRSNGTPIQAFVTVEQRARFDKWRGDRSVAAVIRDWIDSMEIEA